MHVMRPVVRQFKSRFAREVRQEVLESLVSDKFRQALESQSLRSVASDEGPLQRLRASGPDPEL